jgi:hypothetical protein
MPGLVPGIHVLAKTTASKTWMAGTQASGSDAVFQTATPGHDEKSTGSIARTTHQIPAIITYLISTYSSMP